MRKTNNVIKQKSLGLAGIIAILALLVALLAVFMPVDKGKWECAQTTCTGFLSEQEIVDQICSPTVNGVLCSVNVDGQKKVVPVDQINFTGLQFCKEEICLKEVKTRDVNYTFKNDEVQ